MTGTAVVSLPAGDIRAGEHLREVGLQVTYEKVVGIVAATWDYFPAHHNPDYARSQGQRDIYLNTMVLGGFLDRIVLDWAGPDWFVRRRTMRMIGSIYPGDLMVGAGTVAETGTEDDGTPYVAVDVTASTEAAGTCVTGRVVVILPPEGHPTCPAAG
jgi:hypothetical protein